MRKLERKIQETTFDDADDHFKYWRTRSPEERLAAVELMRQRYIDWFYAGTERRIQRILEVVE